MIMLLLPVFAAINFYFWWRFRKAFPGRDRIGLLLGIFLAVISFAHFGIKMLEKAGATTTAIWFANIYYYWMGFVFLYFCLSVVALATTACRLFRPHEQDERAGHCSHLSFIATTSLAFLLCLYGYWEATSIRTEHLTIKSNKIAAGGRKIRLVQISDVHLGLLVRKKKLAGIIAAVKATDPDLIVVTGDLVDGEKNGLNGMADTLATLNPRLGKFAVLGNHEYHAGLEGAAGFIKKAGFTLLLDASQTLPGNLTLVGVDDAGDGHHPGSSSAKPEAEVLRGATKSSFTILLKHRPILDPRSNGMFDIQLSGHTHDSQLLPFKLITYWFYPRQSGLHTLNGQNLYINRGAGTWGPPIRLLAPPEITVIDIIAGEKNEISNE